MLCMGPGGWWLVGDWGLFPNLAITHSFHSYGEDLTLSQSVCPVSYGKRATGAQQSMGLLIHDGLKSFSASMWEYVD